MIDRDYELNYLTRARSAETMKLNLVRSAHVGSVIRRINKLCEAISTTRSASGELVPNYSCDASMYAGTRKVDGELFPYVQFTVSVRQLDSFSDERLQQALEDLSEIVQFIRSEDHPDWSERYYLSSDLDVDEIRIKVEAKLSASAKGCKRVQVGENRVPERIEPVYEFVCD